MVKKHMHLKNNGRTSFINIITDDVKKLYKNTIDRTWVATESLNKGFISLGTKITISENKRTSRYRLAFCLGYIIQSDSNYISVLLSMFLSKMFKYKDI